MEQQTGRLDQFCVQINKKGFFEMLAAAGSTTTLLTQAPPPSIVIARGE